MTDGLGTAGGDLQRPLDESVPIDLGETATVTAAQPAAGAGPATEVVTAAGGEPATEVATAAGAEPATEVVTATGVVTAAEAEPSEPASEQPEPAGATVALRSAVPEDLDPPAQAAGAAEPREINLDAPLALVARHARRWLPTRALRAAALLPVRAGRRLWAWSRRPAGRFVLPGVLTAVLVGAAVTAGALVIPTGNGAPTDPVAGVPGATAPVTTAPGTVPGVGPGLAPPVGGPTSPPFGNPSDALTGWAQQMSTRTGIPMVAVRAYGYAELVLATSMPGCQLRWTTLAGIGQVESGHGTSGATLLDDGRALPSITGPPLDGTNDNMLILDTDNGVLDNDPIYDRAVGPMQFIPSTWYATADPTRGMVDINDIDDAALAAGHLLCSQGRDLSTPQDWWSAILSYNNVQSYASAVFSYADQYGQATQAA